VLKRSFVQAKKVRLAPSGKWNTQEGLIHYKRKREPKAGPRRCRRAPARQLSSEACGGVDEGSEAAGSAGDGGAGSLSLPPSPPYPTPYPNPVHGLLFSL